MRCCVMEIGLLEVTKSKEIILIVVWGYFDLYKK